MYRNIGRFKKVAPNAAKDCSSKISESGEHLLEYRTDMREEAIAEKTQQLETAGRGEGRRHKEEKGKGERQRESEWTERGEGEESDPMTGGNAGGHHKNP